MGKNRNQHFVPRHYLKRFSFDGGKRIRLFNLKSEKYITNAPLKSQCSSDYFYTDDLRGEKTLNEIEDIAEELFREICTSRTIPRQRTQDLVTIMSLMHSRTRRKADADSEGIELLAKRQMRMSRDPRIVAALPMLDQFRIKDKSSALRQVKVALRYPHFLYDLALRLIVAHPGFPFITSDHPVVFLNQAFFEKVRHPKIMGIASRGFQMFLPISPKALLMAYDGSLYRVGNRRQTEAYQIERAEDCDLINALQIINAEQNIYFMNEDTLPTIRKLLNKFLQHRNEAKASEHPIEMPIDGVKDGYYCITRQPIIPVPGKWSFCRVKQQVTERDFGLRDPRLAYLVNEHSEFLRRTKHYISFDQWLEQQRAGA